jgi:putative hemolysin
MEGTWQFFLSMTVACILIQAFFAMLEMASVSFNKVRLQYYVSKNHLRAKWLSYLLNHPAKLFGTTLIGVNTALQMGSESSRRLYDALNLNPDWSAATQVVIVLIFAELSPLIAARRYAEHVALLGVPILYFASLILTPVIWFFDIICRFVNKLVGSPPTKGYYLSREELQKMLEESDPEEFQKLVSNIFTLKTKTAKGLMTPLKQVQQLDANATIFEMRKTLLAGYTPYLPLYQRDPRNIVAIAYPRDLLRLPLTKRVRDHARAPWFITESISILQILKQFRRNNKSIAVVLNETGHATGILTLDSIIDEIFGRADQWDSFQGVEPFVHEVVIERTFSADTLIAEFNEKFHAHLKFEKDIETLGDLMAHTLGHLPAKGESVVIDEFEFTVEEATLLGAKTISVHSL